MPSIDFIKVRLVGITTQQLENHPDLNFYSVFNFETGEIREFNKDGIPVMPKWTANYRGMTFVIYINGSIYLLGSLHKFYNCGAHNYNDFDLNALQGVLKDLENEFGITPDMMVLKQLELGVNIVPPIPSYVILKNLFHHKTDQFVKDYVEDEGSYKQTEHLRDLLKVYDKGSHYKKKGFRIDGEILRFEVKWVKMEYFKNLGIYTLQDLLDHGLNQFTRILVRKWKECLFFDPTIQSDSPLIDKFNNPNYWQNLLDDGKTPTFNKQRRKLRELIENSSENISGQICDLIENKSIEMTRGYQMDTLTIMSKPVPLHSSTRVCEVTGINIEMQRNDSRLLSITGLKYYYKTDKKIYQELERKYLTDRWRHEPIEKKIEEIAHNIRNEKYNKNNNLKRRINRIYDYPVLFNPHPFEQYRGESRC